MTVLVPPEWCTSADHVNLWRREPVLASKVANVYHWTKPGYPAQKGMTITLLNGRWIDITYAQWLTDECIARIALEA